MINLYDIELWQSVLTKELKNAESLNLLGLLMDPTGWIVLTRSTLLTKIFTCILTNLKLLFGPVRMQFTQHFKNLYFYNPYYVA